jgi:CHAD domain-containing protein
MNVSRRQSSRRQIEKSARKGLERVRDDIERVREDPRVPVAAAGAAAVAAAGVWVRRLITNHRDGAYSDSTAYRLRDGESVSAGIKRVVLARIDNALAELQGEAQSTPAEAIHEARKDMKKIRSAIRLVRDTFGDDLYRRENQHYRDIGRELSGLRDAEVLVETLNSLATRFGPAHDERYAGLRSRFEQELQARREDGSQKREIAAAIAALVAGRGRVESWPLDGDGWDLIAPGIHRSYRRGRKRLRETEQEASDETLHEWRKRAKDLWYQLRLIRDADPDLVGTLADQTHDLSDHLGDDHDLVLLREQAQRRRAGFGDPGDQRLLLELIDQRRGELQFAASSLGERIYSEKPKKFVKRLEARWKLWRKREPVAA